MTALSVLLLLAASPAQAGPGIAITPAPARLETRPGSFRIGPATRISVADAGDPEVRRLAEYLAVPLRAATGFALPLETGPDAAGRIRLALDPAAFGEAGAPEWTGLDPRAERYRLEISDDGVRLTAPAHAGLFRGLQTLRQLLPPAFEDAYRQTHGRAWGEAAARQPAPGPADWTLPAVLIEDAPRFRYRGLHLDVGRHFFPVPFIRKYIDLIAQYRLNVFHWHLTEDQGWRIESRRYPRLTQVGAFRRETILEKNFDPFVGDGVPHGGFYTQDEVREIVAYAAERYVTIVPEIEMPGHSRAALAAYPELACTPGPFEVSTVWGVHEDVFCPSERTFEFLQDVLDEVIALFPGPYIHIGGDEVPKVRWRESELAQAVIRREGLPDEDALQSWFVQRIERHLTERGRKLIGWDEILEGGIPPRATVMSWRGVQGGIEAARQGHDVIMTPTSHLYFDYYQGEREREPLAIGGFLPLAKVYEFEPVPAGLTPDEALHVLGAQGNLWTEYMSSTGHVEYMTLPRLLALAEITWSPAAARSWPDFEARLPAALDRLGRLGVSYRPLDRGTGGPTPPPSP